jgi:hypothetical protein
MTTLEKTHHRQKHTKTVNLKGQCHADFFLSVFFIFLPQISPLVSYVQKPVIFRIISKLSARSFTGVYTYDKKLSTSVS